jgi:prepilin-type N-terminal cleavage/methylation domain-containing protein
MKKQSGFSLVELITTVAVVATLSLASYPAMESWQHKEKVRAEIKHLVKRCKGTGLGLYVSYSIMENLGCVGVSGSTILSQMVLKL